MSNQLDVRPNYAPYVYDATINFLTVPKRPLAGTWFAYALDKLLRDTGLQKGALARKVGKTGRTMSRWLHDDGPPPPNVVLSLIEKEANRAGWFEKHRPEYEKQRLKRLKHAPGGDPSLFHREVEHSPTIWMDVDDLLREAGLLRSYQYPVAHDVMCRILNDAAAELSRIADETKREQLFVEIAELRARYGCEP